MSQGEEQPLPPNGSELTRLLDGIPCFVENRFRNFAKGMTGMLKGAGPRSHVRDREPVLFAEAQAHVARAVESCERLDSFLQDTHVLRASFSVGEELEPVDVQVLLDAMLRLTRVERERTARLETDFESPLPRVMGDKGTLARVFFSLIINALGLMRSDPPRQHVLGVHLRRHEGRVGLTLSTTGRGIPSELMPRLFDPLCPPLVPGSGQWIGLSLSRTCLRLMGGDLRVESPPEGGVTFSLLLPVARRLREKETAAALAPWRWPDLLSGEEQRLRALRNDLRNIMRAHVACLCLEVLASTASLRSSLKRLVGCLVELNRRKSMDAWALTRRMLRAYFVLVSDIRLKAGELRHLRYRPPERPRMVEVHACLTAALRIHHDERARTIRLETDFTPRPLRVPGSESHLRSVFLRLIRMCLGGWRTSREYVLRVRTVQEGRWVRVTFSVTDHVLPPESWGSVVEEGYAGGGIEPYALPISLAIVQAMDGEIRVDSQEGVGTNYSVLLPVVLDRVPGTGETRAPSRRRLRVPPPRRLRATSRRRSRTTPRVPSCETSDMSTATIAALEAAAANNTLHTWLAALPKDVKRWQVRRALELDRRLWTEHPASIASCLLARTLDIPELAALREAWMEELDSRGIPWIRPLRALPIAAGLLAELHAGEGLSFDGLDRPRFESDGLVLLEARIPHPNERRPPPRRKERLCWDWERGEAMLEPVPPDDKPREGYPRFERDSWRGPEYLVRAPGQAREQLPCPPGGEAYACFSADGQRLIVYGAHDEYAGGFVYVVDPATLAIERRVDTDAPVNFVHECSRADLLLLNTSDGLVLWSGEHLRPLPISAPQASLSPSGRYVATFDKHLRIWLLSELLRTAKTRDNGFLCRFDPSGTRLLSGRRLFDGRTGEPIAELIAETTSTPESPWLHLGERFLVIELRAWDMRSGASMHVENPQYFNAVRSLAYDRTGSRIAVLHWGDGGEVELYGIPDGRRLATMVFRLKGTELAMSADGETIAVREGLEVEVRAVSGALLRRFAHPSGSKADEERLQDDTLRFSADGQRIASFRVGDGWRIWSLQDDHAEHLGARKEIESHAGFAAPRPHDWDIEAGTQTLFVHRPTGTRIALPVAGPWVCNPTEPRFLACDELHLELRAR